MTSEVTEGLAGIRMARTYRLEEPLARAPAASSSGCSGSGSSRTAGRRGSRR